MRLYILIFLCLITSTSLFSQAPATVEARVDTSTALQHDGHYLESLELLNSIASEITPGLPVKVRYTYYENLAYALFVLWDLEKAEYAAKTAISIAEQSKDRKLKVQSYSMLGNVYAKQKRENESIHYQKKALNLVPPEDSLQYYAILINMNNTMVDNRQFEEGLKNLLQAKGFYTRSNRPHYLSTIENNLGELYREGFKDIQKAILHYRIAEGINKQEGYTRNLLQNYHNLGIAFLALDQVDSALFYVQKSNRLRSKTGDVAGMAHGYTLMGNIYLKQNKPGRAMASFQKVLQISKEKGIDPGIFYANFGIGRVYETKGQNNQALKYYKRAEKVADISRISHLQTDITQKLYEIYKKDEAYKQALAELETLNSLDSTQRSSINQKELNALKLKYENKLALSENKMLKAHEKARTEQLQKEEQTVLFLWIALILAIGIGTFVFWAFKQRQKAYREAEQQRALIQKHYRELKQQEEKLKTANDLKNLIFSVVGHDLREPLTALSQILSLANSGDLSREEMDLLLDHIQKQTDTNLKSLQNILLWARSQVDSDSLNRTEFEASEIIHDVVSSYGSSLERKEIKVDIQIDGDSRLWADPNQFKSIVQNLTSNAIKFSPVGERLILSLQASRDKVTFKVADHGVGVNDDFLQHLTSSSELISARGTEGEKGTGIGLRLVHEFVKCHQGKFHFLKNNPTGTIAVVEIPRISSREKTRQITDAA